MTFDAADIYTVEYDFSQVLEIHTFNTSLILGVSGEVYELYRGGRIDNAQDVVPPGAIPGGEEFALAYSAFGGHLHKCGPPGHSSRAQPGDRTGLRYPLSQAINHLCRHQ